MTAGCRRKRHIIQQKQPFSSFPPLSEWRYATLGTGVSGEAVPGGMDPFSFRAERGLWSELCQLRLANRQTGVFVRCACTS